MADPQTALLPCPFCGRPPEEVTCNLNGEDICVVACNNGCGASGPFLNPPCDPFEASEYATRGWNERVYKMSNYDYDYVEPKYDFDNPPKTALLPCPFCGRPAEEVTGNVD